MSNETRITSFKEFYPFYLAEHSNTVCRVLHYIGSSLVLALLAYALITAQYSLLWFLPVLGYGFAWVGHFFTSIIDRLHLSILYTVLSRTG